MTEYKELAAKCGIYCGQCTGLEGKTKTSAKKLKELIEQDFNWIEADKVDVGFDLTNFKTGLDWFINHSQCPGCNKIKEHWCDVQKCPKIKDNTVENCLLCEEFLTCPRTEYQRKRYPFVIDHYYRIKEIGFEKHLKEEQRKAEEGLRIQDIREY
ncbi:MAG: DUF3795 domain-containing protein [Candidatus Heimdallarchaeota archaeon]|nr:DUF3795 domain-containing protein [Candidatus Heimdallarchaeota archaeon]